MQEQKKFDHKWFKRHILVDHSAKVIHIQVMWDQTGHIRNDEVVQINKGNYKQFLPADLDATSMEVRRELAHLVASNYQVKPMFFQGIEGMDHAVLQITPFEAPVLANFEARN